MSGHDGADRSKLDTKVKDVIDTTFEDDDLIGEGTRALARLAEAAIALHDAVKKNRGRSPLATTAELVNAAMAYAKAVERGERALEAITKDKSGDEVPEAPRRRAEPLPDRSPTDGKVQD